MSVNLPDLFLLFPLSESSQQLQLSSVGAEHVEKSPDLTAADTPANTPSQQQISAAEQKSRMDLQMSTALHGTTATTQLIIVVIVIPILNILRALQFTSCM